MPSPALIVPLPAYRFPNKPASNVPNNILRKPPFCSFASLLIALLTPFVRFKRLNYFMISFIFSLEIINVVVPNPNIFL